MRLVAICCLLVALTSCTATPQRAQQDPQARRAQAQAEMNAIADRWLAAQRAPSIDPIRDKVYLGRDVRQTPLPLQVLDSKPKAEEKKALEAWHEITAASRPELEGWARKYTPWGMPILALQRAASYSLLAKLYAGEITYGEFNRQRMQIVTSSVAAMRQREDEVRRNLQQQAYAQQALDIQRSIASSAALRAYSDLLVQQQLLNQQFQPVQVAPFNCTRFGNTASCF
jgi:hypothetical protein